MDDGEITGQGTSFAPIRLIGRPVVDRADAFDDEQSDTAELPRPGVVAAAMAADEFDRLVAPSGSGMAAWWQRIRGVLVGCWLPLLLVAALCAGPTHLVAGRVSDTVVAAPMLSDLAGGIGLLLLPLMWLSYLALAALPVVLCLAGAAGVAVTWGPEGRRPRPVTVVRAVVHRLGPLWAWLAAVGAVADIRYLIPADAAGSRGGLVLSIAGTLVAAVLATLMGVLGCVVLFERQRGPRRVFQLLSISPGGSLAGLGLAGVALVFLPSIADRTGGRVAASAVTVGCALLWAVAALITYAQARRVEEPLTSARLRDELAA